MALEYFPCYHSYRRKIAKLSDQEVGRLFRSLLEYAETGETQELAGREAVAFDFIADDIDRAKEAYDEKCDKNRRNGSKGANATERPQTPPNATDGGQTPPKTKPKPNTKPKAKENNPPLSPLQVETGFGEELHAAVCDWVRYKAEKKQTYKPTGLQSLIAQIKQNADVYGETAVAELIRECMASNWQGIIFDKLKKAQSAAPSRKGTGDRLLDMINSGVFDE